MILAFPYVHVALDADANTLFERAGALARSAAQKYHADSDLGDINIQASGNIAAGLICELTKGQREPLQTHRSAAAFNIVAAYMGYDPSREHMSGFEPTRPPNGYEDDPLAFTRSAIFLAIDLVVHPLGLQHVVNRAVADMLLATRGRENWRVKTSGGDWYYPAENDIARARRMLECASGIARGELAFAVPKSKE